MPHPLSSTQKMTHRELGRMGVLLKKTKTSLTPKLPVQIQNGNWGIYGAKGFLMTTVSLRRGPTETKQMGTPDFCSTKRR